MLIQSVQKQESEVNWQAVIEFDFFSFEIEKVHYSFGSYSMYHTNRHTSWPTDRQADRHWDLWCLTRILIINLLINTKLGFYQMGKFPSQLWAHQSKCSPQFDIFINIIDGFIFISAVDFHHRNEFFKLSLHQRVFIKDANFHRCNEWSS